MDENEKEWTDFVDRIRRDGLVEKIGSSHIFLALVPDEPDVKVAVELGFCILLDKPILTVVMPGREIPKHLARASDMIVYADIDTEEGRAKLERAIDDFMPDLNTS